MSSLRKRMLGGRNASAARVYAGLVKDVRALEGARRLGCGKWFCGCLFVVEEGASMAFETDNSSIVAGDS